MRVAFAALVVLQACSLSSEYHPSDGGGAPTDFTVGGVPFHISSGGTKVSTGVLTLWFSDQPDTCLAVANMPVGISTYLQIAVSPQTDGGTSAAIVPPKPIPAAGEATASLTQLKTGTKTASFAASDGIVAWTPNADGSTTLQSIDAGFAGTSDRIATGPWTIPACP